MFKRIWSKGVYLLCLLSIGHILCTMTWGENPVKQAEEQQEPSQANRETQVEYLMKQAQDFLKLGYESVKDGDIPKAIEYFKKSLQISQEIPNKEAEAYLLWMIGGSYQTLGELSNALQYYENSLDVADEANYSMVRGLSLLGIGEIYEQCGNRQGALEYLVKSLEFEYPLQNKALVWDKIGKLYYDFGEFESGLQYMLKAQSAYHDLGDKNLEAYALGNIGLLYSSMEKYPEALDYYMRAYELHHELENQKEEIKILVNIGNIYFRMDNFNKSLEYSLKSLEKRREIEFYEKAYIDYYNAGRSYRRLGNLKQALYYLEEALAESEKSDNLEYQGNTLLEIAEIYTEQEDFPQALDYSKKALEVWQQLDSPTNVASILGNLGFLHMRLEKYQEALTWFEKALSLHRELGDFENEFRNLSFMCEIYQILRHETKATDLIGEPESALDLPGEVEAALINEMETALQRLPNAIERLDHMLKEARKNNDKLIESWVLINIAKTYMLKGEIRDALQYYQQALSIPSDDVGEIIRKILIYNDMGLIYARLNDLDKAEEQYKLANNLLDKLREGTGPVPSEDMIAANLGTVYLRRGDLEKAEKSFNKALTIAQQDKSIAPKNLAYVYQGLTSVFLAKGEYNRALTNLERAYEIFANTFDYLNEGRVLLKMGELEIFRGKPYNSLSLLDKGLIIAQKIDDAHFIWQGNYLKGEAYEMMGDLQEACDYYSIAIETLESIRGKAGREEYKLSFFDKNVHVYPRIVKILLQLNSCEKSFAYAERGKARGLLDLLAEANAVVTAGISSELLRQKTDLNARIVAAETNLRKQQALPEETQDPDRIQRLKEMLDRLKHEESMLLKAIAEQYPRYADLTQPKPVTLAELQKQVLRENEVLLEYAVTDKMIAVFVVAKKLFKVIPVNMAADELTEKVNQLRTTLLPHKAFDKVTAYELYTKLFQPVETYLTDAKVVYIVPDGALYYLPFETLITKNEPQNEHLSFLLTRDYHIAYIQSASVLKTVREDETRRNQGHEVQEPIIVFADPVYPDEGQNSLNEVTDNLSDTLYSGADANPRFRRLEWASKEAESIATIYQVDQNGDAYNLRDKAKESRVKNLDLSVYHYVHFAVHGLICDETKGVWMQPSLVLSLVGEPESEQAKGNEGFLQMSEVFNLSLQADLVTLSACQTGLGKNVKGEGLVGLTRTFMYAGTPSVVVSLWSVADDPSAVAFMKRFYRYLNSGMTKAEALRETKLWMIKYSYHTDQYGNVIKHNRPFHWAPFILIGAY